MSTRSILSTSLLLLLMGCLSTPREDYFLDPAIPRIETDTSKIAYIRTEWSNDRHVETAFLDSLDRVLEVFKFGRYSIKTVQRYKGANNTMTINYTHSDSSPMGYVDVDTLRRTYDTAGRLAVKAKTFGGIYKDKEHVPKVGYHTIYLDYTAKGDTLIGKVESSYDTLNTSTIVNIDRWEKDDKERDKRHYRLYVMKMPSNPHDTIYHFSQRYTYDSDGKLIMAWFDYMHLGQFYSPAGPDTIWYSHDSRNRLVAERHRYTTDMSNKSEPDTTEKNNFDKEMLDWYRKRFFVGDKYFPNNNRVNRVRYEYERFDPKKHLPLKVPVLD